MFPVLPCSVCSAYFQAIVLRRIRSALTGDTTLPVFLSLSTHALTTQTVGLLPRCLCLLDWLIEHGLTSAPTQYIGYTALEDCSLYTITVNIYTSRGTFLSELHFSTIAASTDHSRFDYCNFLYYSLLINRYVGIYRCEKWSDYDYICRDLRIVFFRSNRISNRIGRRPIPRKP